MARESQPARTGLTLALNKDIWRANFYRFCQLLEQENPDAPKLGTTSHPGDDPVRFRPWPGMGFPVSTLKAVETDEDQPTLPPTVRTTFLGMYGVDSPLPTSYLDDIAQRCEGHEAVTSFLDIFSHRITTQYYRIWRKYAWPATFEAGGRDATSQCLLGLVGLGIPGTAEQVATPVSRFLALLGTMRLPTRNAEGIRALVSLLAPNTRAIITEHLQMSAAKNVAVNAGGDISVGTMGNLTALAGEKLGLFARSGQLSLKSGEGPVDVHAQNASMRLFAEKKLTLSSASDISFAGKKRITLIGGGSYLRLEAGKVEYGTTASYMRKVKRSFKGTAQEIPMTVQEKTAPVTLKSQDLDSSSLPLPQKNSAEMIKSSGTASQNESYASAMVNPAESPDKKKLGSVKRYLYSPFTFDTNVLLYDSLAKFIDSENDYYIVFVSEKQKEQFYNQLNEEEELIKEITLVKMNESGRTHSMNEVEHYYKEFKTFHMSYEKYHFEPGDNATIVHILGHGDAGDDGLAPSPYAKLRSYKYPLEIIPQMKKMQLPIDAIIKLDFCWSGAGKRPEGNTADELTQAFHLGRITELVQGEEPCFLDAFIGEFNEYFPEFVGEVHGYIGTVLTYRKNIMNEKVNTGKPHFSVAVAPDEGADELFFRKSDMRIIRKV